MREFTARLFTSLFVVLSLFCNLNAGDIEPCEYFERIVPRVLSDYEKEAGLKIYGVGGGVPDEITKIIVSYQTDFKMDVAKARRLFVMGMEKILKAINSDEQIRPYLKNFPFKRENINISISSKVVSCESDSDVDFIFLAKGKLYFEKGREGWGKWIHVRNESYEEAFDIVMGIDGMCRRVCENDVRVCTR